MQNVIPIKRGQSALKLTTSSYWPPSGENFDRDPHLNKTKTPGKYGVHPEEAWIVELEEDEVILNYQKRQERDLEGLIQPMTEPLDSPPEPHIDRPLRKAIEYFEGVFGRRIAA